MKIELPLDAEGINRACEEAGTFLSDTGLSKHEAVAGRLSFENVLLMWRNHFGDGVPVIMRAGKMLGKPSIMVAVRGVSVELNQPSGVRIYQPIPVRSNQPTKARTGCGTRFPHPVRALVSTRR